MEKVQKERRMKRKNIKIIAGIVLLLAFAGIGAYVIISTSNRWSILTLVDMIR